MKLAASSSTSKPLRHTRPLALSIVLIVATIFAGIAVRFVPLGLPAFVVKYGGSMLWALMFYWLFSAMLRSALLPTAALITAAFTTGIELFKLIRYPALDAFRLTLAGVLLFGRFFSLWDIVAYWVAICIGVLVDMRFRKMPE